MTAPGSPAVPPEPSTAGQLLRDSALPAAEARALLCQALGLRRETLIAHPDTPVATQPAARFAQLAARRAAGMPMAYLTGVQEFYGHEMAVSPDVLIPRPETELLVETALQWLERRPAARVVDLGTGSGCIAIALALARPDLDIVALDLCEAALQLARHNAQRLGARVRWLAGDWLRPLRGRFDLIVSNPPYIAGGDDHLAALAFEPRGALTDEADGLGHLRTIVAQAPEHLEPAGALLVEHGHDQGSAVRRLMRDAGMNARTLRDLAGHERACIGSFAAD